MAETLLILAQADLPATTLTDVYICGSSGGATISSIYIANRTASQTTFRISVAPAGAGDSAEQYLYYDIVIPPNDTFVATVGLTLANTDVLRAYAAATGISVNVFGVEVS